MKDVRIIQKALEQLIPTSSKVFIVGHDYPDYDALSSAIGLQALSSFLGKEAYIVINDTEMPVGVRKIKNGVAKRYNIINREIALSLIDEASLLILTDVNKSNMISLGEDNNRFDTTVIIDHHNASASTVKTPYKYIDLDASSASEIVAETILLTEPSILTQQLASFLLTGIALDTNKFQNKVTDTTNKVIQDLIAHGASPTVIQKLLSIGFEHNEKIKNLVINNTVIKQLGADESERHVAFTLNRTSPTEQYLREELAIAADELLSTKAEAAFSIGYTTPDVITVSGRSKCDIDVSEILSTIVGLDGGGNRTSAGARTSSATVFDVEEKISERVQNYLKCKQKSKTLDGR